MDRQFRSVPLRESASIRLYRFALADSLRYIDLTCPAVRLGSAPNG